MIYKMKTSSLKQRLACKAFQEGKLNLKGNEHKAGPAIEQYLEVFRETLAHRNPLYKDPNVGYDWCCAYVYYLMRETGYNLGITPLTASDWTLGAVRTWYLWALQEGIFFERTISPEPGDLVLFDHLIEETELDHIGIVLRATDHHILTSEGNYHNRSGIFRRKRDNHIYGYIKLGEK